MKVAGRLQALAHVIFGYHRRPSRSPTASMQSPPGQRQQHAPTYHVRSLAPGDLTDRDTAAWAALEARAVEPNAYASPHFVLPALRHLDPGLRAQVTFVERIAGASRDLVGAGVFQRVGATRSFPLPHLESYCSRHSYFAAPLFDREHFEPALVAMLDHVCRTPGHNGIDVPHLWADGRIAQLVADDGTNGVVHADPDAAGRAVLHVAGAGEVFVQRVLAKRLKDLERRMRRLAERGRVGWRCHREGGVPESAVERFLELEHAGWKGQERSSMRSNPADEAFFREAMARFGRDERAVITELTLDDVAIASTAHFISGRVGFGFKIGWDPAFKAVAPGVLNEVELMRRAPRVFADLEYFDSGSNSQGYINDLWPARRPLASATLTRATLARLITRTASSARTLKRRWQASHMPPTALQVAKPEWLSVASDGLATVTLLI